jgi:hypothetical protein
VFVKYVNAETFKNVVREVYVAEFLPLVVLVHGVLWMPVTLWILQHVGQRRNSAVTIKVKFTL